MKNLKTDKKYIIGKHLEYIMNAKVRILACRLITG
jgi:hypothetical protein